MNKIVVKFALFLLCFAIGSGFVWYLSPVINIGAVEPAIVSKPEVRAETVEKLRKGKGLEVIFKEFIATENGIVVDYEITNYTDKSYFYRANMGGNVKEPFFGFYQLKIGEKEPFMMWCGTGTKEFELKSGESKIFRVDNLSFHWEKNKNVRVGYHFRGESDNESQTYWSDKLPINDSTAKLLLKEKARWK